MPLPTHISRVAINAVLDLLFPLLLTDAGGSQEAACRAALEMLAEYHPNTAEELGLAGEIIAFRLHALGTLRDSAAPGATRLELLKTAATRPPPSASSTPCSALAASQPKNPSKPGPASRSAAATASRAHGQAPSRGRYTAGAPQRTKTADATRRSPRRRTAGTTPQPHGCLRAAPHRRSHR
ncbi:MAG: hypothetical protein ACJ8AI_06075 [Rhodopila sp.]